ncbi:unnamed protein product, partial [Mesorhabditis spiculigera]
MQILRFAPLIFFFIQAAEQLEELPSFYDGFYYAPWGRASILEEAVCGNAQVDFKQDNSATKSILAECKADTEPVTDDITIVEFGNTSILYGSNHLEGWWALYSLRAEHPELVSATFDEAISEQLHAGRQAKSAMEQRIATMKRALTSGPANLRENQWLIPDKLQSARSSDHFNITPMACLENSIQFRVCRHGRRQYGQLVPLLHKGWFEDDVYKWIDAPLQLYVWDESGPRWINVKLCKNDKATNEWRCEKDNDSKFVFPRLEGGAVKEIAARALDFTFIRHAGDTHVFATNIRKVRLNDEVVELNTKIFAYELRVGDKVQVGSKYIEIMADPFNPDVDPVVLTRRHLIMMALAGGTGIGIFIIIGLLVFIWRRVRAFRGRSRALPRV